MPNANYLVVHLIFEKKNPAYAFLSLLMYDQSSTMLYFCQRHFNSNAFISSIFIIDLITKLLILSSWQHFFFLEKKGFLQPSSSLHYYILTRISESNIKYLGYRRDLIITCTSAKNLFIYSELDRPVCTSAYVLSDQLRKVLWSRSVSREEG